MAEAVAVAILASMNRKARRPSQANAGSLEVQPALTSAAIISPFQSARTLSSRPARTRRASGQQFLAHRREPFLVLHAAR
jgi:hypothetical protein